ncbi:MAG TPA: hypothetical protein VH370_04710 [Humisphaera sp.]|nr:hypothetical protein [Humisphaera sp.]
MGHKDSTSEQPGDLTDPPPLRLEYGHAEPFFEKGTTAAGWVFLGFIIAVLPVLIIGVNLYDINTGLFSAELGYRHPRWHNWWGLAFFWILLPIAALAAYRSRSIRRPARFVLLGLAIGFAASGLLEGLCFAAK